ncbi:MAG: hypothetical protein JXR63_09535 [Spirochaetales bacterium]|nr:hypothetical protein [Spirochaetales bacterium]
MVDTAKNFFLGKNGFPRKNCAESVKGAFETKKGETQLNLGDCGSGRAPEGLCGACYATYAIINSSDRNQAAAFLDHFRRQAGSVKCSDIRSARITSCIRCVEIATEFLEEKIDA